ncbi:hypothetical protein [Allobaculum sp. JKK-2023]|uniref:hypothetical protein n=1 Tax=Allobaculum sp. JKK-2023 TaxID=3108943 RepID=UPI002B061A24|nr:hypothetical protein [Allobaculum sp. JKK-2023]
MKNSGHWLKMSLVAIIAFSCIGICSIFAAEAPQTEGQSESMNQVTQMDAESIDSENIDSENIDSENIDSENIDSENIDSENIDSENIDSENIDSENIDSDNPFENLKATDSILPLEDGGFLIGSGEVQIFSLDDLNTPIETINLDSNPNIVTKEKAYSLFMAENEEAAASSQ